MKKTIQVINKLKKKGVIQDYAIGDAVASFFYLEATLTEDLDIFIQIESTEGEILTLSFLFKSLEDEGYKEIRKEGIIIDKWPVQFLPVTTDLEKEALGNAIHETIEGESVKVFSSEYLMAICLAVGRSKDKIRFEQFYNERCYSEEKFMDIISRHNLIDKYNKLKKIIEE
ncbi:MAG TPA: hypothetical protein VJL89_06685 [Thermodesulfovibrionia bacterium]|nr:hypothetical protein [Thermodesulfovibrionia bacterium]